MRLLFIISLLFVKMTFAQEVKVLSFSDIQKRVEQGKDTTYVINFWATWCGPCVKELPHFDRINSVYADQKLKVLLLSIDYVSQKDKRVQPFVKKNKVTSEVIMVDVRNMNQFIEEVSPQWSGAIPATLIINQERNTSSFYEQEFTYPELEKVVLSNLIK